MSFFLVPTGVFARETLPAKPANEFSDTASLGEECCGGTHSYGMFWPSLGECKSVLVCVHGLGLCAKGYKNLGERLAQNGITTYAVDVRGFGEHRYTDDKYRKLDLNSTVKDLEEVLELLATRHPHKPIFVLGESMGGSLTIKLASLKPPQLQGIVCSAPAWRIYQEKRTASRALLGWLLKPNGRLSLASNAMMHQATTNKDLRQHWISDMSHKLNLTPSEALRLIFFIRRTPQYAKKVDNMPVLIVQGLKDRLVKVNHAPKLLRKMPTKNKELLLIADAEHLVFEEAQCSDVTIGELTNWMAEESQSADNSMHKRGVLISSAGYSAQAAKLFCKAKIENIKVLYDQPSIIK